MERSEIENEIVDVSTIKIHKIALENPMINGLQYDRFKSSIDIEGQQRAIDVTYDLSTFNGRTRLTALRELGIKTVIVKRQPKGTSDIELRRLADTEENRRHATTAQLAAKAWKLYMSGKYATQSEAAAAEGVSVKMVERMNKIGGVNDPMSKKKYVRFNRLDIIEILYNGGKVKIPNEDNKFTNTDSPQSIINYLTKSTYLEESDSIVDMPTITELTKDEEVYILKLSDSAGRQSALVRKALISALYNLDK